MRRVDKEGGTPLSQRRANLVDIISPPSDQCTDEIEARLSGGAPDRSMLSRTADVQSPSSGCRTVSTVNPSASARVCHSSTGEE